MNLMRLKFSGKTVVVTSGNFYISLENIHSFNYPKVKRRIKELKMGKAKVDLNLLNDQFTT